MLQSRYQQLRSASIHLGPLRSSRSVAARAASASSPSSQEGMRRSCATARPTSICGSSSPSAEGACATWVSTSTRLIGSSPDMTRAVSSASWSSSPCVRV